MLLPGLALAAPEEKQQQDDNTGQVYETVVSGKRSTGVPSVRKIRRHEIQQQGAHSVADVLELEPAVNTVSGTRGERMITLRGFTQRQVVVLVDGAPSYIPYDGQVDLNMVPAELVDHVTVIKGPGSVLYGPNGMGGAVNIVTRQPGSGPLAEALVEVGRSGFAQLRGYHTYRAGPVAWAVHGGLSRVDDLPMSARFSPTPWENGALRANSDRASYHVGARLSADLGRGHRLDGGALFLDGRRGVPPSVFDSTPKFWRFNTWRAVNASLGHRGRYGPSLEVDELVFVSLFDNLLDSYDDATYTTQDSPRAFSSWYHDRIVGGRVRARYTLRRQAWGMTFKLWTGLSHDRHQREDRQGAYPAHERFIFTAAPEVEARVGRWTFLAALQAEVELPGGDPGPQAGVGPLLSVMLAPRPGLQLRATAARRGRFPTLKERFSTVAGVREPNPGLRPEATWNFTLEGSWRATAWLTVQAAAFESEVSDLVEVAALGGGLYQMQNVATARMIGAELALALNPTRWLRLDAGYGLLHARRTDRDAPDDRLQYRPAHKATLRLRLAPWPRWGELSTQLRVVGPQAFVHPETLAWGELGTYLVWDARLCLTPVSWIETWISARNITDASYQTKYGYPDPGRQVWVGLKVSYDPIPVPKHPAHAP